MQLATLAIWWFGLICWGKQAWAAAFDSHGSYAKSTRLDNSEHPLLKLKLLNSHIDHWKNSTWICPLPRQVAWGFACSKVDGLENVLHHLTWCRKQSPPAFQPRKGCRMFEKPYPKHHVYCLHVYTICISSVCMLCMYYCMEAVCVAAQLHSSLSWRAWGLSKGSFLARGPKSLLCGWVLGSSFHDLS